LDGEGRQGVGGEPLVGGLFGLVEGLGFVAEGDGADDGNAQGADFGGIEGGEEGLGVAILRLLWVLLAQGMFGHLGVFFAEFVVF
jgi:hypothetical protein